MDRESPELIEREMEQTRESLTEKVSLLENKVIGQVQSATDTVQGTVDSVQDTVHSVKSAVQDTVQNVSDTIKDTARSVANALKEGFDLTGHVQTHPVGMVTGAAAAGFITGLFLFRRPATHAARLPAYTAAAAPAPAVSHRPQWLDDLLGMAVGEIKTIAQQALTTASASLKQTVQTKLPQLIESAVPQMNGNGCRTTSAGANQYETDLRQ